MRFLRGVNRKKHFFREKTGEVMSTGYQCYQWIKRPVVLRKLIMFELGLQQIIFIHIHVALGWPSRIRKNWA